MKSLYMKYWGIIVLLTLWISSAQAQDVVYRVSDAFELEGFSNSECWPSSSTYNRVTTTLYVNNTERARYEYPDLQGLPGREYKYSGDTRHVEFLPTRAYVVEDTWSALGGVEITAPSPFPEYDYHGYAYENSTCYNWIFRILVKTINIRITDVVTKPAYYCEDEKIRLSIPDGATNVQWKVGNSTSITNMRDINISHTNKIDIGINDIIALGLNPYQALYFYTVSTYAPLTNRRSDVKGQYVFAPKVPVPALTIDTAKCARQLSKLTLANFRYTDGTPYNGGQPLDITVFGSQPGNSQSRRITGTETTFDVVPDSYIVYVENQQATCKKQINIVVPSPPPALRTAFTESCVDGLPQITLSPVGGKPPYYFSMTSPATSTNNVFSHLRPDTVYQFYVSDQNGCLLNAEIPTPAAVTATTNKNDPVNPGGNQGSIQITPAGGAGAPYTYSVNGGAYQSSNLFETLTQGTYIITIQDKKGCTGTVTVELIDPEPIVPAAVKDDISCNGLSDGHVTISATGGLPPFNYSSDGTTFLPINEFYDLAAGDHTFYVQDSKGNSASIVVNIKMPDALTIAVASRQDAICKGIANGAIAVTANGGTGAYRYQLDEGQYQAQASFAVRAGNYTVTVLDDKNCKATTATVSIAEPALFVRINAVTAATNCNAGNDGTITITAADGVTPYRYKTETGNVQTANVITGLTAGTYTVIAIDNNGCEARQAGLVVNQPPVLQVTAQSQTNASCFGVSDGRVTVAATGGTGNIRYFINSAPAVPNTTGTFINLPAGDYVVTARDDNNCNTPIDVRITQPDLLTLQGTVTDVACNGGASGKVVLQATGGTGAYAYSINNISFKTSNVFDLLTAGSYTFYVQDEHSCIAQVTKQVNEPDALSFTQVVSKAVCNGGATGTITVTPAGGTAPYEYNVDGNTFRASNILSGIAAGVHSVSVKDAMGCVQTNNGVNVGEPDPIVIQLVNEQAVSCFGGSNGAFGIQVTGGTGTYQYALNNGVYQTAAAFSGLVAGTYTLNVKDANNCVATKTVTVVQPDQLSLQVTDKTDINCAGEAIGAFRVQAAGGAGNYQYSLDGTAFQTLGAYSQLAAGTYTITVQDDNQCTRNFPVILTDLYAPLTASLNATPPPTCADRGTIEVTNVQGGSAPYSYSLDNSNYATAPLFSNLFNGEYVVYVKDDNGCTITRSIAPYGPVSIRGTAATSPVSCNGGNNGSLTIAGVTGGNNVYEYSLDGINYQSSPLFNQLRARTYQVYVRDIPYSCQAVLTAIVSEPDALSLRVINNQPVACYNENTGAVQLAATGGAGVPYTYTIDGNAANNTGLFTALSAKTYGMQVSDQNGCSDNLSVTVTQPGPLVLQAPVVTPVSCNGKGDGKIILTAAGGVMPYAYTVDGNNYQLDPAFAAIVPATYSVQVRDANGCIQTQSAQVTEPDLLRLSIVATENIACNGAATGEIEVSAAGGVGNYTFSLNGLPYQPGTTFNHLQAGNYLLSVADGNDCITTQSATLTQPDRLQATKQLTQPSCDYLNDGRVVVTVSGGVAPYQYQWSTGSNDREINGLSGGLYKVLITDAHGCTTTDSALLVRPDAIAIDLGFKDTILCVGQTIYLDAGNPGARYAWTSDAGFSSTERTAAISKDGDYSLTVTSPGGCSGSYSFNVQTSTTALTADFLLSSYGIAGDTVMIIDVSHPKPGTTEWTLPAKAIDAGTAGGGSIRFLLFDEPGEYTINFKARLGECADMISKSITILPETDRDDADSLLGYRESLIRAFVAYPNPNEGQFKVHVNLSKAADVQLKLVNFNNGNIEELRKGQGVDDYEFPFAIQQLPQGIYLITLQVGDEYKVLRVLKM